MCTCRERPEELMNRKTEYNGSVIQPQRLSTVDIRNVRETLGFINPEQKCVMIHLDRVHSLFPCCQNGQYRASREEGAAYTPLPTTARGWLKRPSVLASHGQEMSRHSGLCLPHASRGFSYLNGTAYGLADLFLSPRLMCVCMAGICVQCEKGWWKTSLICLLG